jgi:hypothetical protein
MKKKRQVNILKASGELAPFNEIKLRRSLEKAGAEKFLIDKIIKEIFNELYEGISTAEIYRKAFEMLRSYSRPLAAKYRLKNAIMDLGPSGFPFEKYVSELLQSQGFNTITNQFVQGKCVTHEVDVIATTNGDINYIECKYHNQRGLVCDVKVPLYIHSRFMDLKERQSLLKENEGKVFRGWVVTNTKFSEDAVKYGLCSGLELIGWDFPTGRSLRQMIDITGLYPITCITSLSQREKQALLDENIVLTKELQNNRELLLQIGMKPNRLKTVLDEAQNLCTINTI